MDLLSAFILGIVQGITEWLPISSSGHLVIFQELFGFQGDMFFDLMLHVATLIVVVCVFYKEIYNILKSWMLWKKDEYFKLGWMILLGSIFTAFMGFVFRDVVKGLFENLLFVGIAFVFCGLFLLLTRFFNGKKKITELDAMLIGLMQGVALIPGVSRSGSTIATGLILGVDREKAMNFSFLLLIPAVVGAMILEFDSSMISGNILPIIIGMSTAMVVGYIFLKVLMRIVRSDYFWIFGMYCISFGLVIIALKLF